MDTDAKNTLTEEELQNYELLKADGKLDNPDALPVDPTKITLGMTEEMQDAALAYILQISEIAKWAFAQVERTYWRNHCHRTIFSIAHEQWEATGKLPSKFVLQAELENRLPESDAEKVRYRGKVNRLTSPLWQMDDAAYVWSQLRRFVTKAKIDLALGQYGTDRDLENFRTALNAIDVSGTDDGIKVYSIADLAALPPVEWLIHKHFQVGGFGTIYGPSGSGKSFVAIDQALCLATGKPYLGEYPVKQCTVSYCCGEGREGLSSRISAWCQHYQIEPPDASQFRIVDQPYNLLDEKIMRRLAAALGQCGMIYIDTLARFFGPGDENSTQDMNSYVTNVAELGRLCGSAVMSVHHTGKDFAKGARGASSLKGACDTEICIDGSCRSFVEVRCAKQKNAAEFSGYSLEACPIALENAPEGSLILSLQPPWLAKLKSLNEGQKETLDLLTEKFNSQPFSHSDGARVQKCAKSTYGTRLKKLIELGCVNKLADDHYSINVVSVHDKMCLELHSEARRLGI